MTKQELVNYIANKSGLSKKDAGAALSSIVDAIKSSLKKGDSTTLIGFGTFSVSKRNARQGRNPQTGGTIDIPARNVPVFKASSSLKSAMHSADSGLKGLKNSSMEEATSHGDDNGVGD